MADTRGNRTLLDGLIKNFSLDPRGVNGVLKNASSINEKLSKVAISAASRSADISNTWTKDTLARLEKASKTKEDPTDYASSAADLALGTLGDSTKLVANFVEVARSVQTETLELLYEAGRSKQPGHSKSSGEESCEVGEGMEAENEV